MIIIMPFVSCFRMLDQGISSMLDQGISSMLDPGGTSMLDPGGTSMLDTLTAGWVAGWSVIAII